jgi:hypothetical protein
MVELGDIEVTPREILWESKGGSEWIHIAYPVAFKEDADFIEACHGQPEWLVTRKPPEHPYRRIVISNGAVESWPILIDGKRKRDIQVA